MRAAMIRLSGFATRRRWIVIGIWAVLLVAAIPLAMKQTENLTGGGFDVPGSASEEVSTALADDYPEHQNGAVSVVLEAEPGARRRSHRRPTGSPTPSPTSPTSPSAPTHWRRRASSSPRTASR
jgi:hypothetical protein